MKICVYGAASPNIDSAYVDAVEQLGKTIAERGHELVFGAGANGLMGAVARGAKQGGGKIHGIIPYFFKEESIEAIYDGCDELTFTTDMRERKQLMENCADAFIVAPGGIGTYEEFYEILTLRQLGRHDKPIVIFNFDGYYDDLLGAMNKAAEKGFITEKCRDLYGCTGDAEKAVCLAEQTGGKKYAVFELKQG